MTLSYPYHRYLAYRIWQGDGFEEVREHLGELEYIPPSIDDVKSVRERLDSCARGHLNPGVRVFEEYGLKIFEEKSPSSDMMYWIVETPVARTCAERLLLDRVHPQDVAVILRLKYNDRITEKSVNMFRDGFWDTCLLTPIDFAAYMGLSGHRHKRPPSSVSLATRPDYSAWKEGLIPSLGIEEMLREIQVDAFMRFKESSAEHDDKSAMDWAKLVMKTGPVSMAVRAKDKSSDNTIFDVKPIFEYPDYSVPTLGDIHTEYSEIQSGTGSESLSVSQEPDDKK